MRVESGDLWAMHEREEVIVITTNGDVRRDGQAVMGRGVAAIMKDRYPQFPIIFGRRLERSGNHVLWWPDVGVFTFPVKHHWAEDASMPLIEQSARELEIVARALNLERIYLPKPGCGNGRLEWSDVGPAIAPLLGGRFIVLTWPPRVETP